LLTAEGVQSVTLRPWDDLGVAADDVIKAATTLDNAGLHGPYAIALATELFNRLYRRYPQGNMIELDHIRTLVTEGIMKAPAVKKGGILINTGRQYVSLSLGQDLMTAFVGPAETSYEFAITESLALRILVPGSICILKPALKS